MEFSFCYIAVRREPFTVRQEQINNLVVLYFRCVTKPHVFKLQWHSPEPKYFKLWERLIGRKNFKVTKNNKVCSNHFVFGKPLGEHLHPELWLRGYDSDKSATLNVNAAAVIDTWSNGDKQDESVYKTTRKGTIKKKKKLGLQGKVLLREKRHTHCPLPSQKGLKESMTLMVLRVHLLTQKLFKTITHTCTLRRNRLKFVTVNLHYASSVEKKFYMSMKKMNDFKKKTRN